MNKHVLIAAILYEIPTYNTIQKILTRMTSLQLRYTPKTLSPKHFTETMTAQSIFEHLQKQSTIIQDPVELIVMLTSGNSCIISFEKEKRFLRISIAPTAYFWEWEGDPSLHYIDFGRYMLLLLDICEDFPFAKITTVASCARQCSSRPTT